MELRELISETICALADSGIENAGFEAAQLLEKAGITRLKVITEPGTEVSGEAEKNVREMLKKRVSGYPLQYILGEWEFYGLPFEVGEGVLIPRQDTETLAELALEFLGEYGENARVLDLCAGSGCIGITLAKLRGAKTTLVEKSEEAFAFLEKNIAKNNAETLCKAVLGDCFEEYGEFELIVSNPPYLTKTDMENLQREVTFEPKTALFGGEDGLDFYRGLLSVHAKNLAPGGVFAAEIGLGQEKTVMEIFRENGLEPRCEKDTRGIPRVVYGFRR